MPRLHGGGLLCWIRTRTRAPRSSAEPFPKRGAKKKEPYSLPDRCFRARPAAVRVPLQGGPLHGSPISIASFFFTRVCDLASAPGAGSVSWRVYIALWAWIALSRLKISSASSRLVAASKTSPSESMTFQRSPAFWIVRCFDITAGTKAADAASARSELRQN